MMRLAYASLDEVNHDWASQIAAACGAVICRLLPGETPPDGLFDAILYDLDEVPSEQRPAFLEGLCVAPPACPTAVHGFGVTDEQAHALRNCGVAVSRRLRAELVRGLHKAAHQSLATVPPDETLTDVTWINVVE